MPLMPTLREGIKRKRSGVLFEKGPHFVALAGLELTEITCFFLLLHSNTTPDCPWFDNTPVCLLACFPFPCLQACCDLLLKGLPESPFPGSLVLLLFSLYNYFKTPCFVGGPVHDPQSISGGQRELVRVWSSLVWDPCIDMVAGVTSPLYTAAVYSWQYRLTVYKAVGE